MNLLKGKKTYIVGTIVFILGGLQAIGFHIPPELFTFLGGLGLWTMRAGITNG